jgi:hypothetical protein
MEAPLQEGAGVGAPGCRLPAPRRELGVEEARVALVSFGPTWAGPSCGLVLRPFSARDGPLTDSCEEGVGEPGPGAGGLPGGSSDPVGGPSPVHTNMWWWIQKGRF